MSKKKRMTPSEFMRQLRPELYSDTLENTVYQLDSKTLEYSLETITARNQMHDFEIFCRKLCERTICPHLKPATGPEGGGDSKADTETIPVAEEIAFLTYVGEPKSVHERWAFAFSAKKKWAEKVRNDVAGIITTERGYQKIYCITAQFARAKDRARIEDELSRKYGVTVTILDRSWIVDQVVGGDRKDLAFNYLGVGQEVVDTRRLGPSDYSRTSQLEDIEKVISDPEAFSGMENQRVTEALIAAKLSRNLERPRVETEGRFARAVRLAERDGSYRQKLKACYEQIWTAFWWFDDIQYLNDSYSDFEALVIDTEHAKNLELLCNLAQLLFNSVIHYNLSAEDVQLDERIARLTGRLQSMTLDAERPNNALEALTSLLSIQANQALLKKNYKMLSPLWPQFSEVVSRAKGLGEFSADRLIQFVEVFGSVAGNDSGYAQLVDDVADFVSERTGEAQGALVLLKRAQQLDFEDNFEMIRLLGKAARQLTKKEYAESQIEALRLLSLAYRSAGMLWAARASCIFTIATVIIEAEEDNDLPASIVPTLMMFAWIAVELRHVPEALEAIRFVQGCAARLPLDDVSKELIEKRLTEFDLVLGSQILNFSSDELQQLTRLPDILNGLGLYQSRNSLLYALGHEKTLRDKGIIPEAESSEEVAEFFTLLASQPASSDPHCPVIFNELETQYFVSKVQGVKVEVHHECSEISILVAEAVIGSIEALFATSIELDVTAHTEKFTITINEEQGRLIPDFTVNSEEMTAVVQWPIGMAPAGFDHQDAVQRMLIGLAAATLSTTCYSKSFKQTIERLLKNESVLDRIGMITVVGNSRQRSFDKTLSRLSDWTAMAIDTFELAPSHPTIIRRELNSKKDNEDVLSDNRNVPPMPKDHRDLGVRSVIDVHLWDRAGWTGTVFADFGASCPPVIALMFTSEEAGRKIFARWRERFGMRDEHDDIYVAIVRDISPEHPAHYRVLLTSRLPPENENSKEKMCMMISRMQTMHAESDINLSRFLNTYNRVGVYLFLPAILKDGRTPELLTDLAILKRNLSVKTLSEVGRYDPEAMALGENMYREKFGDIDDSI